MVPGLSTLLALRGAVLGEGAVLSSGRFLFETVGQLMLLRWSGKGTSGIVSDYVISDTYRRNVVGPSEAICGAVTPLRLLPFSPQC